MADRGPGPEVIVCCFVGSLAGSWMRSRIAGIPIWDTAVPSGNLTYRATTPILQVFTVRILTMQFWGQFLRNT